MGHNFFLDVIFRSWLFIFISPTSTAVVTFELCLHPRGIDGSFQTSERDFFKPTSVTSAWLFENNSYCAQARTPQRIPHINAAWQILMKPSSRRIVSRFRVFHKYVGLRRGRLWKMHVAISTIAVCTSAAPTASRKFAPRRLYRISSLWLVEHDRRWEAVRACMHILCNT